MKATATDDLIVALSELRVIFPEWRMGQLIANLVQATGGADTGAIWEIDDDQLLVAARRLIERNGDREVTP